MKPTDLRRIAAHESGHVLAALLLGLPGMGCAVFDEEEVGVASHLPIVKAPDSKAVTPDELEGAYRHDACRELIRKATMVAAGRVGELLDTNSAFLCLSTIVTGADKTMIEVMAGELFEGETDHTIGAAFAELTARAARRLLGPHVDSLRAIAAQLVERRTLTPADVAEIHAQTIQTRKEETPCSSAI